MPSSPRISAFRTPLAVLGGFAIIAESIITVAVTVPSGMSAGQRWLLLICMVLFLFSTLAALYNLVTRHHRKLYAPFEFRSDEAFIQTMTEPERLEKVLVDFQSAEATAPETADAPAARPGPYTDSQNPDEPVRQSPTPQSIHKYIQLEHDLLSLIERLTPHRISGASRVRAGSRDLGVDAIATSSRASKILEFKFIRKDRSQLPALENGVVTLLRAITAVSAVRNTPSHGLLVFVVPDNDAAQRIARSSEALLASVDTNTRIAIEAIPEADVYRLLALHDSELLADPVAHRLATALNDGL